MVSKILSSALKVMYFGGFMDYLIVDTYPSFVLALCENPSKSPLATWEEFYSKKFPKIYELQIGNYGKNWRNFAEKYVFSKFTSWFPKTSRVWRNLLSVIPYAYREFVKFWRNRLDVVFVVYVGIGCGAGWATEYRGRRAVLLGLENIVDLNWCSLEDLRGLIIHELAHLIHMALRGLSAREFEELESDPLFLLYSEGYATYIEEELTGKGLARIASDNSWLNWCKRHLGFLSREYLSRTESGKPVNDFYGSWLSIEGKSQTGYYLGYEFIKYLARKTSLRSIAVLNVKKIKDEAMCFLRALAD